MPLADGASLEVRSRARADLGANGCGRHSRSGDRPRASERQDHKRESPQVHDAPAQRPDEDASSKGTDGSAQARRQSQLAEGSAAPARSRRQGDERRRARHHERRPQPLHDARAEQPRPRGRESAEDVRRAGEDESTHEDARVSQIRSASRPAGSSAAAKVAM